MQKIYLNGKLLIRFWSEGAEGLCYLCAIKGLQGPFSDVCSEKQQRRIAKEKLILQNASEIRRELSIRTI